MPSCFILQSYLVMFAVSLGSPVEDHHPRLLDDGPRCRFSGICEGTPSQHECRKLGESHRVWAAPTIEIADRDAQLRDGELACTFDPQARANIIKEAVRWTWKGYEQCAWGDDELLPLSCSGQPWFNLTLTAVDGLDTLYLTGLYEEFQDAVHLISTTFAPEKAGSCNLFETTIRILGGLLSAYHLSNGTHPTAAQQLLHAAVDVGARLARGLDSNTGIPYSDVELATGSVHQSSSLSTTSEMTTLSLEFTYLARLTGNHEFEAAALKVHDALNKSIHLNNGILPQYFSREEGSPSGNYFMLGARSDSYYEYLLKQWIMTGKTETRLLERYQKSIGEVRNKLLRSTDDTPVTVDEGGVQHGRMSEEQFLHDEGINLPEGLVYVAEIQNDLVTSKMDHLVCFLPGLLALADYYNVSTTHGQASVVNETNKNDTGGKDTISASIPVSDLHLAEKLADTCYQLYRRTPTGIAPEIVHFTNRPSTTGFPGSHEPDVGGGDFVVYENDAHNLLRPETVESLFILWKVTGNPIYQEQAWLIFRAFEMWSKVKEGGYSSLESVLSVPPDGRDKMESFWLSETLKYLYLIFVEPPDRCLHASCNGTRIPSSSVLPLNQYVFNTEAHPLPIVGHHNESLVAPVIGYNESLLHPFGEVKFDVEEEFGSVGMTWSAEGGGPDGDASTGGEPQQYVLGDNVDFNLAVEMATKKILGSLAESPRSSMQHRAEVVAERHKHHEEL